MDFTILAVVLLIGEGIPVRNKLIRKYREGKRKKDDSDKNLCVNLLLQYCKLKAMPESGGMLRD